MWSISTDRGLSWGPRRTLVTPASGLPVWAPVLHVQARLQTLFVRVHHEAAAHGPGVERLSFWRVCCVASSWLSHMLYNVWPHHVCCLGFGGGSSHLRHRRTCFDTVCCKLMCLSSGMQAMRNQWRQAPNCMACLPGQPDVPVLLSEPRGLLVVRGGRADVVAWRGHLHADVQQLGADVGQAAGALLRATRPGWCTLCACAWRVCGKASLG